MKKIFFLLWVCLFSIAVMGQVTIQDPLAQERKVSSFTGIDVSSGITLWLTQSNEDKVVVTASDEALREKIVTEVKDGVLKIYIRNNTGNWRIPGNKMPKAYVSIQQIDQLILSAGANVRQQGQIVAKQLKVDASSGAIWNGDLKVDELEADLNSGAVLTIKGSAMNSVLKSSSGAQFKGVDLMVESCNASTNSGGGIQINVSKELSAKATSGGFIQYVGAGVIRNVETNSGGSIKRKS